MGNVSREVGNPKKEPKRHARDKKNHHNRLISRLDDAGKRTSTLGDRSIESLKTEKERKQRLEKKNRISKDSGTTTKGATNT